jgi:hypothetical protein
MVQEVQTQGNWYQTPNRIEWIWVSERKISDHSQVRNKKTNMVVFSTSMGLAESLGEVFASSWTYDATDWIVYKVVWGDIYVTQPWAYMVKYTPYQWYSLEEYLTVKVYVDNKVAYQLRTTLKDHLERTFVLNLGLKNKVTVSWYFEYNAPIWPTFTFTLVKL